MRFLRRRMRFLRRLPAICSFWAPCELRSVMLRVARMHVLRVRGTSEMGDFLYVYVPKIFSNVVRVLTRWCPRWFFSRFFIFFCIRSRKLYFFYVCHVCDVLNLKLCS